MLKALISRLVATARDLLNEQALLHCEYSRLKEEINLKTPGNPAIFGRKIYSQFDEDGIIEHVFSRIGAGRRVFVEIGCSNGLENNTHALLLNGWRGAWIDADNEKISFINLNLPKNDDLVVICAFVSTDNCVQMLKDSLVSLDEPELDFLSIDIDGNDLEVLKVLMGNFLPRLLCVEYNAKFPPPLDISINPKRSGGWSGDDYWGASLSAFVNMLEPMGYRLITCNLTGANAFFVKSSDAHLFPSYSVVDLYRPSMYHLRRIASGHPASLRFLADALGRTREKGPSSHIVAEGTKD